MPELPDLQVFSRNLTKSLQGKKLQKITIGQSRNVKSSEKALAEALVGHELSKVIRSGKELHFEFGGGHVLGLHLMLHGQLILAGDDREQKSLIIALTFDDGHALSLTDFQKAATATLDPKPNATPDALDVETAYLGQAFAKTRTPVKTVLMDQKVLRGIGNAYADEILWDARISPFSPANKIPKANVADLAKSIKKVLHNAETQILKNRPDIISGEYRDFMEVHNSRKTKTSTGAAIKQDVISSRKTYYTDEQELFE